nr:MAG TPA: hypothetical protein [Caudoviricetes sp.]
MRGYIREYSNHPSIHPSCLFYMKNSLIPLSDFDKKDEL